MSKVERKEFQETRVSRTVSPNVRGSSQNLTEFDNNLDYLLEDLQNSVSRPGSAQGTHSNYRSNSLNRLNAKSGNPLEYSSDDAYSYTTPDGRKHVEGYKKESYSYKTSGHTDIQPEKVRVQKSLNQLDTLLDDLQQVRNKSSFSEKETSYNVGSTPDFRDNKYSNKSSEVKRELHYGGTPTSTRRNLGRTEHEYSRDIDFTEGNYAQVRPSTPSSRTSTLTKQHKVTNMHSHPVEVIETLTPDINPEVLAHLDPNLRPPGNTKVTTTIKTYTYEIPGSGEYPTNLDSSLDRTEQTDKYIYSPNTSQTTPSKSFTYNKIDNRSAQNTVSYPPETKYQIYQEELTDTQTSSYQPFVKPTSPIGDRKVLKETITTRNYQPGYNPVVSPPSQETYVYNETKTTKNYNGYPAQPIKETYVLKETNKNVIQEDFPIYNPPPSKKETFTYKESNITNRNVLPYSNGHPPGDRTIIYEKDSQTTNKYYQPPTEPINIKYKYSSKSTTTDQKVGYPPQELKEPIIPRPFPTDQVDGTPPKHVDELMAKIGHEPPNSPYNAGYTAHEKELYHQKKIGAMKQATEADELQKKAPVSKTNNVSGPAVYYPPGEMFSKQEESAAWRAGGGYAKESGKYEYGADEKSKSGGKSGAAIIPVCLPCCCGLPCTII